MKMYKKLLALCLLPLLLVSVTSCGSASAENVDMYELKQAMLAADQGLPEMTSVDSTTEKASELFAYLSDFDYEKVDSFFLSYAADGMADEIAVVRLKNTANAAEMTKTLQAHADNRVKLYRSYEPTQVKRAENALVFTEDNYAVLIISEKQNEVKAAFEQMLEAPAQG